MIRERLDETAHCAALPGSSPFTNMKTREHSDSVEECLTRDRGAAGPRLTGVTALCP